jgi:adenosine deaminase
MAPLAQTDDLLDFIRKLPKAELHLHIEGTLEPELMFQLAARNALKLRFPSVEAVREAYEFKDLQSFLDIYYEGAAVLQRDRDFHDLAMAYFARAHEDGVVHAELFFDPQTHVSRGIEMGAVIEGLDSARKLAQQRYGLTSSLILCFLRHLPEEDAFTTLKKALPYRDKFIAVGLDSGERGNPPSKFQRVFAKARAEGLRAVAHAGEEGPAGYIIEALDLLKAERIDHGVRCSEDESLVKRLAREKIPLTMCPLSNVKLRVFDDLTRHNLKTLLDLGVKVTINSDDPAYFGGYIAKNYLETAKALGLSRRELELVAKNSLEASFR